MNEAALLRENEERAIKSLKEALSRKFNLIDLRLFGSKARGKSALDSDMDVMIELAESNRNIESQIDDIVFEINLRNDCFISTLVFSRKELEEGPLSESPIYKIIQREGVSI